jgi:hypothetical protein
MPPKPFCHIPLCPLANWINRDCRPPAPLHVQEWMHCMDLVVAHRLRVSQLPLEHYSWLRRRKHLSSARLLHPRVSLRIRAPALYCFISERLELRAFRETDVLVDLADENAQHSRAFAGLRGKFAETLPISFGLKMKRHWAAEYSLRASGGKPWAGRRLLRQYACRGDKKENVGGRANNRTHTYTFGFAGTSCSDFRILPPSSRT